MKKAAEKRTVPAGPKMIDVSGIGQVKLRRHRRARKLTLSVRPFTGVQVTVPYGVSYAQAEAFVCEKKGWLQKNQTIMKRFEAEQTAFFSSSAELDRDAARQLLVERLQCLARQYGFSYNRVFIRNQKTRWGSCSIKNNINLNIKLAWLPAELRDYVILHELVHTRIKTHGREFWAELEGYVSDARAVDRQLNRYHPGVQDARADHRAGG
ncbi:MAG: M48 family metallopeptidase [Deltaproteobacteria bacterium]|nr:M48 family metallopeptidase [Deltaproteobacteria bacterium]